MLDDAFTASSRAAVEAAKEQQDMTVLQTMLDAAHSSSGENARMVKVQDTLLQAQTATALAESSTYVSRTYSCVCTW